MEKPFSILQVEINKLQSGEATLNKSLKSHTTWRIGGPAKLFYEPSSIEGLVEALRLINKWQVPWFVLGKGSNVLIPDDGINGVVIKLGDHLASLKQEDELVTVEAGFSLIKLAGMMCKKGYAGLEFAGGIPGTVGGGVFMNAGAHKSDMSSIVTKALVLYKDGSVTWLDHSELGFAYRTSTLQSAGGICLAAQLKLRKDDPVKLKESLQRHKAYRKKTQPWKDPCCGSVFRNPLPHYAGQLIEQAGLRGFTIGGAKISEKHGNFIVNTGDASANDILKLITYVQKEIKNCYGISLDTEVAYIDEAQLQTTL
ncbi:UDP-N-acetylmuramate dehydrogenase [Salipaludibacillus agaradhaerens]|uniref:UDP-N-acetylenolpyruvoylglucosamine reductase n=1 Tax=Salipaludibacillus agaradhaerens TaxID=76935 RepID=A0A9Q4B051_SALAG|nr:UDP-N-acetylmuramate dehydrogenase [Salipaludibacillus agaradhaerens]MCR6095947.1 UDP-N-acetylmuramate dehydrogenase [Salipaludibacillus agaradhaerens]MCR6114494.1 UDP-N-acetylmuramate dehydrogenase [Salipaludibacillus agaradhaerens]